MKVVTQAGALLLVAVTISVAVWMAGSGVPALQVFGAAPVFVAVVYAWFVFRREPHLPWEEARERLLAGDAVVLWRPGCPFSESLQWRLRHTPRIVWVNVWHDRRAFEAMLALGDGQEFTPIVLVRGQVLINPGAAEVEAAVSGG